MHVTSVISNIIHVSVTFDQFSQCLLAEKKSFKKTFMSMYIICIKLNIE